MLPLITLPHPSALMGMMGTRHLIVRFHLATALSVKLFTYASAFAPGGQLQSVLMRPTPQLSVKTWGGGCRREDGGGYWQLGGGSPRGGGEAAHDPLLPHAYLKGVCVCVWGHGGIEVCMR